MLFVPIILLLNICTCQCGSDLQLRRSRLVLNYLNNKYVGNFSMVKENQTRNFEFELLQNITENYVSVNEFYQWRQQGFYSLLKFQARICTMLDKNYVGLTTKFLKKSNLTKTCPILKGKYYINRVGTYEIVVPNYVQIGSYKNMMSVLNGNEAVFNATWYGVVDKKLPKPKKNSTGN